MVPPTVARPEPQPKGWENEKLVGYRAILLAIREGQPECSHLVVIANQ